jgi:hypothetical protein
MRQEFDLKIDTWGSFYASQVSQKLLVSPMNRPMVPVGGESEIAFLIDHLLFISTNSASIFGKVGPRQKTENRMEGQRVPTIDYEMDEEQQVMSPMIKMIFSTNDVTLLQWILNFLDLIPHLAYSASLHSPAA